MKQIFTLLLMAAIAHLTVHAQKVEFRYQGQPVEDGATVTINAEADIFGDLSCETNPSDAPNEGLILVDKDGANISGTAVMQILEHTFKAKTVQWCMGGECVPMKNVSELSKTFSGTTILTQFDAYTIRQKGYLLALLEVTVAGEQHSVYIQFSNGEVSGITSVAASEEQADVYDLNGRLLMQNAGAGHIQQLPKGAYILRGSQKVRKIFVK